MELIHYGSSQFKPELMMPIKNSEHIKPNGGLWTSPVDSIYGWKDWCDNENFGDTSKSFTVIFTGRLLTINSIDVMNNLPWINDDTSPWISFENLSNKYDAVHLTVKGEKETRFSYPKSLYGWDCETVLIMNKNCLTAQYDKKL